MIPLACVVFKGVGLGNTRKHGSLRRASSVAARAYIAFIAGPILFGRCYRMAAEMRTCTIGAECSVSSTTPQLFVHRITLYGL